MDPKIINYIKEHPKEADALTFKWQEFITTNARENPEILAIKSKEEFLVWAGQHPEKHIDTGIWIGKEIKEITDVYLRRRQEDSVPQAQGNNDKKEERQREEARGIPRESIRDIIGREGRGFFDRGGGRGISGIGRRFGPPRGRVVSGIGRLGTRLVTQAGMAAGRAVVGALVSNPIGWIVIAVIIAIMLIVFLIIMFAGGGGIGSGGCSSFLDKKVFVTSTKSNGNLVAYVKNNIDSAFSGDGLQAGDRICQWRADNAAPSPLGGTWVAWLSTNIIDAKDRIADQKYARAECDQVIVVDNKADLINGDIDNPIVKDENSNLKEVGVWTGTGLNGQRIINDNCSGWTVGDSSQGGMTGDSRTKTDGAWTSFFSSKCDNPDYHLYCFEQGANPPTPTPL